MKMTPSVDELVAELKAAVRHVPLRGSTLALFAPKLTNALNPYDSDLALIQLWDRFDELQPSRDVEAAKAILGFSWQNGHVLDRKTHFNEEVHPRTVARWAEAGFKELATHVLSLSSLSYVHCRVSQSNLHVSILLGFFANRQMPLPRVGLRGALGGEEELHWSVAMDSEDHPAGTSGRIALDVPLAERSSKLTVSWDGDIPMSVVSEVESVVRSRTSYTSGVFAMWIYSDL
jgi:hypothetical protein